MFSKNNKKSAPSLIATDVVITGSVNNQGLMQLDGTIKGEVSVESLTIGHLGSVEGQITASEVTVKGKVEGTITADKVILEKTAQVIGDIFHGTISIEEGATVQGAMKHKAPKSAEKENVTPIKDQEPTKKSV